MGTQGIPARFRVWVAASTVSQIGDAILYFGLGWYASAHGGGAAGLVLAAVTVPRAVLMLVGGAVSDRRGPRAVLLAADVAMATVALTTLAAVAGWGTPLWLLAALAAATGTLTSFAYPAAGAFPALIVPEPVLPRALALRNAGAQLAALAGNPLGGLVVAAGGMVAVLGLDALSFATVVVVVALVRTPPVVPREVSSLLGEIRAGLRVAAGDPALRQVFGLYAVAGGLVLPLEALLLPLLARSAGWSAAETGLVAGAIGVGAFAGALLVSRTGTHRRAGLLAGAGLAGTAMGAVGLVLAPGPVWGIAAGLVDGLGLALFIAHAGPVIVARSPAGHLSRMQALLGVVQSVTLVATNALVGLLASLTGPAATTFAVAAGLAAAGVLAGTRRTFDRERVGGGGRESNPPDRGARPRRF